MQATTSSDAVPTDCLNSDSESGCVLLYLGESGRPQIDIAWESTEDGGRLAKVQLAAEEIPKKTLFVRAFGMGGRTGTSPMERSGTPRPPSPHHPQLPHARARVGN